MKKFTNSTVFTIAHRLSTIVNYDRVMVMDNGQLVEFDIPYKLLVNNDEAETIEKNGFFATMVKNTGPKTS